VNRDGGATRARPRTLRIFGTGGHGRELAWVARATWAGVPVRFVVDDASAAGTTVHGLPVDVLADVEPDEADGVVVALGSTAARRAVVARLEAGGHRTCGLVHPAVDVSGVAQLGHGAVLMPGVVLTVDAVVGEHVHVNVGCTVSHDALLDAYATMSPGVHLAGWVHVGEDAFIGTGASVGNGTPERRRLIGAGSVVGAGACVIDDVPPGALFAGVPARAKR
jgi:sugar O-acyltransferase (sialic acid O-acetyltransferase NeuD family)